MKRKAIAVMLSSVLMASLLLTGCDENGLPTEEEINEITQGLDDFSAAMEEVSANVTDIAETMEGFEDVVADIEVNVEEVQDVVDVSIDQDVLEAVEGIADVADEAGAWAEEVEDVANALEDVTPDVEKLATDIEGGIDNMGVIAEDLTRIYTNEQIQDLIGQLEGMIK